METVCCRCDADKRFLVSDEGKHHVGQIADSLTKAFRQDVRKSRRVAKDFSNGLPFDLPSLEELAEDLQDPQHVLYVAAQNFASVFAESVSSWPEFSEYCDIAEEAQDQYMPSGPPKSPLTVSYFTLWAFLMYSSAKMASPSALALLI